MGPFWAPLPGPPDPKEAPLRKRPQKKMEKKEEERKERERESERKKGKLTRREQQETATEELSEGEGVGSDGSAERKKTRAQGGLGEGSESSPRLPRAPPLPPPPSGPASLEVLTQRKGSESAKALSELSSELFPRTLLPHSSHSSLIPDSESAPRTRRESVIGDTS